MKIAVIVMPRADGNGFKARIAAPWNVAAEADTADAAFRDVANQLRPRVPEGTEFGRVDMPKYDRLFDVVGGLDPNSPAWAEWASEVDAYRAEVAARDCICDAGG